MVNSDISLFPATGSAGFLMVVNAILTLAIAVFGIWFGLRVLGALDKIASSLHKERNEKS